MNCIGTWEGFLLIIAAGLSLMLALGVGVLIGYFALMESEKWKPARERSTTPEKGGGDDDPTTQGGTHA
jgi:hypothetical protein